MRLGVHSFFRSIVPTALLCVIVMAMWWLGETPASGYESSEGEARVSSSSPPTGSSFPPIVFVSRNSLKSLQRGEVGAIPGFGPKYRTAKVGGKLVLRHANGTYKSLLDSTRFFDVADPCVSWDAKRILFSGVERPDSSWRIYQINSNGTGLKQLTFTNRAIDLSRFGADSTWFLQYDDFDPCYLPDGRVVFASTRYPSMALLDNVHTSNLYVMKADGAEMHRITSERNGAEEPTIDPVTGKIVYARWWVNIDMPSNVGEHGLTRNKGDALTDDIANIWQAIIINPDGNELKLYAGFPRTRFGTQTYKPGVMNDGRLLSVFSPHTSLSRSIGGAGIRWFKPGADFEHYVIGTPSAESLRVVSAAPPFATDPVPLSDNAILLSYSHDGIDYGIYSVRLDGSQRRKIIDLPGTLELEPQVLQPRRVPPILADQFPAPITDLPPMVDSASHYRNDLFRFDCMNIYTNGAVDEPIPDGPHITIGASIRFFISVQGNNPFIPGPSILLKEVPVFNNGGVHEPELPADMPLFEQIADSSGKVLEAPGGRFAHVPGMNFERIGGGTKCVGCHVGHSILTVPVSGSLSEWFNVSTSATVSASSYFTDDKGHAFLPQRVVDRQARTGGDTVNWVSNEGAGAFVEMKWDTPIEIREFKLYNVTPNPKSGTSIRVEDAEIFLFLKGEETGHIRSTGSISPDGTRIKLSPSTADAVRVIIKRFRGTIVSRKVAGLAEVETIARIASY